MKEKIILRTGIYVRVSTEEQAQEGFSVRAQMEKLKAYALLKDWEIFDIYADEGISGKNIVDRPAINRMIEDINAGKVNNVLVFKVDRLTRSTKNLIELVDLFEEKNCAFNSLTESIDTDTPSGRMFLKIIGIFAEFERENLSIRKKLGNERKVKEGYTLANFSLSYGYEKEKGEKIQKIVPIEAKIVKEIFCMFVDENKSMGGIARAMNERKIPTKRNGKTWGTQTVKLILTNPTYIGKVRYSMQNSGENKYFEVDGHHEPIITDRMFYLAQEKINNMPNIAKTKRPKEGHYFCGILVCGLCGGKFTTHSYLCKDNDNPKKKRKASYRCGNKQYYNKEIACKSPEISHEKMEHAFIERISKIANFTEAESVKIENGRAIEEKELLEYIFDCEEKLKNLEIRKKRLMEQYISEEIPFGEYKSMIAILNEKYDMLEKETQKSKSSLSKLEEAPHIKHEDIIINIKENWDYLTDKEKMMFLHRFVKRAAIKINKERRNSCIVHIQNVDFNFSSGLDFEQTSKNIVRSNRG